MKLILLVLVLISHVWAYSSGPPESVCDSMIPSLTKHGQPQQTSVPYVLFTVDNSFVKSGDKVILTMMKKKRQIPNFKGFMFQAFDLSRNVSVGRFEPSHGLKIMGCGEEKQGAISHQDSNDFRFVNVTWIAPKVNVSTKVHFFFTVVQSLNTFWAKNEAREFITVEPDLPSPELHPEAGEPKPEIEVQQAALPEPEPESEPKSEGEPEPESEPKPEGEPEPKGEPVGESEPEGEAEPEPEHHGSPSKVTKNFHQDYKGCGETKGCIGIDPGCLVSGNCKVMITHHFDKEAKNYTMVLHGSNILPGEYIAAGISIDSTMGEDLVFFCFNEANGISVSWNSGKSNIQPVSGVAITDASVRSVNGILTCHFVLPEAFTAGSPKSTMLFNLTAIHYFTLLATGPLKDKDLTYHILRTSSNEVVNFSKASVLAAKGKSWLIQSHGSLMVVSWLACASSGMIMARYFRTTWQTLRPCGKDFWFIWHQMFMATAISMTLIGFVVIAAEVYFEPFTTENLMVNPHALFGVITIALALIQLVMALLRPHPDASKRGLFNWAHWFIGNLAFLFSLVAIFLAVELPAPRLPQQMTAAMIAFVVVHCVTHCIMMLQRFYMGRLQKNTFEVQIDPKDDESGGCLRMFVFTVYFFFVWSFAIAFVVIIIYSKL